MTATRYDTAELLRPHKTPEGYLLAEGIAVKPGVYPYLMPDGSVRMELKPEDEIFHPDSLASMGRKPVTLDHPWDAPNQQVTADNVDKYGVGDVDGEMEVTTGAGGFVKLKIAVRRADAVKAVESKRASRLSLGLACRIDETPGEWNGKPYHRIQRGMVCNHHALVEQGRVPDAHLRTDAAIMQQPKEEIMGKWTVGGKEYECPPELADALRADAAATDEKIKADEANFASQMKKAKEDAERLKGELDATKAKIADIEMKMKAKEDKEKDKDEEKSDAADLARFEARLRLVRAAEKLKVDGAINMSDAEIRKAIAEKAGAKTEGRSDAYVEAFSDIVIEQATRTDAAEASLLMGMVNAGEPRNDAIKTAREAYAARQIGGTK